MQNKFTPEISKSLQHPNKHEVKTKIDELSGQHWVKEIRELSSEFSLDAQKIITNVKNFLADAIDGETLKKEFEENKDHYQKYYTKLQNETFNEAKEITEALIAYGSKVKENTQTKLTHLLISNPGIETKMPVFMKNVLGEEAPVAQETPIVEETKESIDQDQKFIDEITEILHKNISEEEMASAIKEVYPTIYGKNMVLKIFYKKLWLTEKKDIQARAGIEPKIVELLILIKKNPEDAKAKAELERKLHPGFVTEGEQEIQKPGVKVVGTVDLSKFPQGKKDKKIEVVKKEEEFRQDPTTDLLHHVGEKMSLDTFLQASTLTYKELRINELKGSPVAGRYRWYNPKPTNSGKIAHFFTVWFEKKDIHRVPVNAFVEMEPSINFDDDVVYKIKILGIKPSNKTWDRKQSKSVQGELFIEEAESNETWSGNRLEHVKWGDKLKIVKSLIIWK